MCDIRTELQAPLDLRSHMANSVDLDQTAPRSSLFWVHAVCFYTQFVSNVRQLFAEDDFSRRHFQMHFFLCAVRVKGTNI